jgi:type II secretory pathway pseudopilin PulG
MHCIIMRKNSVRDPTSWCPATFAARQPRAGFTVIEVLIVTALLMLLAASGFGTLLIMDRNARRQAETMSGFELVQGQIEYLRSLPYNPPTSPFLATTNIFTNTVNICLNSSGSNTLVSASMITTLVPITQGHLASVSMSVNTYGQARTISLQSVINSYTDP